VQTNGGAPRARTAADDVTASELAAFSYCAKAWHLERVAGRRPSERATRERDTGIVSHARHGAQVRAGGWLRRHSSAAITALLILAVLLFLAALRV
jgi:hypothetical protein